MIFFHFHERKKKYFLKCLWITTTKKIMNCYFDIVMIDSIFRSFCLCYCVPNGLSYSGEETRPTGCKKDAKREWDGPQNKKRKKIYISCYTEYKAFGLSLIYNIDTNGLYCFIRIMTATTENFLNFFYQL